MPLCEADCAVTYKVLILGDETVGKTALLNRLVRRGFSETMRPTIGVDFVRKIFEVDGALIQLMIWDTSGQVRFRSITRLQYKGVQGIVLVYDVTNEASFETLQYWLHSIQMDIPRAAESYEPVPVILCGNKCDLLREKKVSALRGHRLANREMAFGFYETSAKTGQNVDTMFQRLAFYMTDIFHPKLMKSYHPNLIRPITVKGAYASEPVKLRQFRRKRRFNFRPKSEPQHPATVESSLQNSTRGAHSTKTRSLSLDYSPRQASSSSSDLKLSSSKLGLARLNGTRDKKIKDTKSQPCRRKSFLSALSCFPFRGCCGRSNRRRNRNRPV